MYFGCRLNRPPHSSITSNNVAYYGHRSPRERLTSYAYRMPIEKQLVWMDVDTQFDFVSTDGAFGEHAAAWHIERIVPNLRQLANYAAAQRITTLLPTDAHVPHDPEFSDAIPA